MLNFLPLATVNAATLDLDFDTSQLFVWTQTITDALMPVIYITCGIALGFIIIKALKSAFN